jgi:heptosyltransferase I
MLSAVGDAVHVLPVVHALKRRWPESHLTWVIQSVPYELVAGHPLVDDFVVFQRRHGRGAWRGFADVRKALRGRPFDLLLGLQVYFKAGLITALAEARVKMGFDRRRARDLQWLFTNRRIPARGPRHVQDQYFEFLEYLGVDPEPVTWGLAIRQEERAAQRDFFARLDQPACAIVVGTSKPAKNWTVEGYAGLVDGVESRHGLRPVLVGGMSDVERRMADGIESSTETRVVNALENDLRKVAWLLEGSALVVSPDTGPLHIARAFGTPVVGLYGHTNPKRTGPYRAFEDLVVDGYAAYAGEEYPVSAGYRDGMRRVTVEMVLEKVDLAMRRYVH